MAFGSTILKYSCLFLLLCIAEHVLTLTSSLKFEPRSSNGKILACYYRPHMINETQLPTDACTHIILAFGAVSPSGIKPLSPKDLAAYRFALLSHTFLAEYNFDGIDLDWEFPSLLEKQAYSNFIMILSTVLHWSDKLLSFAIPNDINLFERGYFPDTLNKYADFMTIMTYDFHGYSKTDNVTGFNSPLYSMKGENPFRSTAGIINYFLYRGVSPSKMLLGFPTYSRTWTLANASVHGVHAPAVGLGAPGPVTKQTGYYLYQDTCTVYKEGGKVVTVEEAGAEYLYNNVTWVPFNGMYSVSIKTDWLKKKNLAGVGVWTFEDDDPNNVCGLGSFPVLHTMRKLLDK